MMNMIGRVALVVLAGWLSVAAAMAQTFPSPDAAAAAFVDALKGNDEKAMTVVLGPAWRELVPADVDDDDKPRERFLAAWGERNRIVADGDSKAKLEVGPNGWTFPIPLVKEGGTWRFDLAAGRAEIKARFIGRNEITTVQTLLAIIDAQRDYAALDPMKTGRVQYSRRLLSSPGKKDGLYWESAPGEPLSPIGPALAKAQTDGAYNGYRYRLLYAQGPAAPGGAYGYLVGNRMLGFAIIAWPVKYGETGVMTFIASHAGDVYERDFGPDTAVRAGETAAFNPDKDWEKADTDP
jgi:hypothetical protein